jgi:hypothetical protein
MVTHGLRLARVDTVQNRPESWKLLTVLGPLLVTTIV